MKFQRRGVYTSCDGRDAQFVPDGDRGRFRFHAEQAPMNDVSATSMSWYWLSGHDDADLAIYDGNGIR